MLYIRACEQDDLLGMISLAITDSQITASSVLNNAWSKDCLPANGRLYMPNGLAWCPKYKSSTEWLQVDLGIRATVLIKYYELFFSHLLG
ncbi:unnamed protein product [Dibothriocephalus latus]|uniref:F5/8 type C domain-containing protein n=1 Tax=Dibothriocephalus latus TaxID=60516 RepID=A0A3P6TYH9_DIBLA|nr:unnamed protein product [Dibothriocephalus latus]